ncbi:MAG: 1-deoxy-D-xylulose-5-phosphate reductoisomerase, partial [Deltaproteobacteria bacterium]|nr:1-deoxy-D-xylulose-5-phosphate reductoisomerase [Deltaproteobacteria bacterium]
MKNLTILGSTGSIGVSTLEIVAAHPDRFRIVALTAGKNLELFARQIRLFAPRIAVVASSEDVPRLQEMCSGLDLVILGGVEGLIAAATADETEMVVAAIVGAAGLIPTAAAIRAGKDVA